MLRFLPEYAATIVTRKGGDRCCEQSERCMTPFYEVRDGAKPRNGPVK